MAIIIDFIKYKADREIDMYFSEEELYNFRFACPDCLGDEFNIFIDMTAECCDCGLEILLQVQDDD